MYITTGTRHQPPRASRAASVPWLLWPATLSTSWTLCRTMRTADILYPYGQKLDPSGDVFWTIRFSTFCTKTHFPENQKS